MKKFITSLAVAVLVVSGVGVVTSGAVVHADSGYGGGGGNIVLGIGGGNSGPTGGGGGGSIGQVLGASTTGPTAPTTPVGQVLGASTTPSSCSGPYMTSYLKIGRSNNPPAQVMLLQKFLNANLGTKLTVSGTFDQATFLAVEAFQTKYYAQVLMPYAPNSPAGTQPPTGFVYIHTLAEINALACSMGL